MLVFSPAEENPDTPMSTVKRILALIVIFVFATIAWAILGATIFTRTYGLGETLKPHVSSTWGTPQLQGPPTAFYEQPTQEMQQTLDALGRTITKIIPSKKQIELPLDSTRANVALNLDHRQKGLLWYSTYKVVFAGEYAFRNTSDQDQDVT